MACSFEGCDRAVWSKGLCSAHYKQQHKGQELRPLGQGVKRVSTYAGAKCAVDFCDKTAESKGYCGGHYAQWRTGKEFTPIAPRAKRGSLPPKKPTLATAVRAWARENGIDVPAKGKIPWQVMEDWRQAQN